MVKKREKIVLSINCKKRESILLTKSVSVRYELETSNFLLNKVHKFNYLGNITTDGKSNAEIEKTLQYQKMSSTNETKIVGNRKICWIDFNELLTF